MTTIIQNDEFRPVRFNPGEIMLTRSMWEYMEQGAVQRSEVIEFLHQHLTGDWGDLCEEDKQSNEDALTDPNGARILSKYALADGDDIYIVTEWDRSYTTIMRTSEY